MTNKTRTRAILELPSNGGEKCSQLVQTKSCDGKAACADGFKVYRYKIKKWSSCSELKGKSRFGSIREYLSTVGVRQRDVTCIDEKGANVNER